MKSKLPVILVILVILGLGLAVVLLFFRQKETAQNHAAAQQQLTRLSNVVEHTSAQLTEQVATNITIKSNLAAEVETVKTMSNELATVSAQLAKAEADAKAAAQAAQEEMTRRDAKINELETQRDELTKRMTDLSSSINNLETQISATEKKLAASEGDRAFLLKELKRLQTEKAELEKQLTSLAFLREQIHKVREELSISRRLDWIRRGLYGTTGQKGAEKLLQGFSPPAAQSNYNLNVELRQDGSVKVLAPTNAPAATNKPAAK